MDIDKVVQALVSTASDSELATLTYECEKERKRRVYKHIEANDIPLPTWAEISEARKSTRTIQPIISYRDRTGFDLMVSKEVIEYFRELPEDSIRQWKTVLDDGLYPGDSPGKPSIGA